MNILFIFPPGRGFRIADKKTFPVNPYSPPLGILYLSKILEKNNHNIKVLDFTAEEVKIKKLRKLVFWSDIIGMTIITSSFEKTKELAKFITKIKKKRPLLIGGPHCALDPKRALQDFKADICVRWESEQNILPIIEYFNNTREISEVPGIYYLDDTGKINKTDDLEFIKNLDNIDFPSRKLVEKYDYGFTLGQKMTKGKTTAIITTRGCPYNCKFCSYNAINPKYRERSVKNVIDELKEIKHQGFKTVIIVDNNFLANKKRVSKIMDEIIENKLNLHFWIMAARVDSAHPALYKKMKRAGVKFIAFGIESANQKILDFYNKKITPNQIRYAVNLSHNMGFITSGSFIFGAPMETKEAIEQTINFACDLPLDIAHFLTLGYYRGAPLWEKAVKEGKISLEEYIVDADSRRNLSLFSKEELNNFCLYANKRFYFNPKYLFRQFFKAIKKIDFCFVKAGLRMFLIKEE